MAQADIQQQVANQREHFDSLALQLGFVYGLEGCDAEDVSDFKPRLLVGGRMPHAWLERDGTVIPLLDLLDDRRFTLLVGKTHAGVADDAAAPLSASVRVVAEGKDFNDPEGSLRRFADLAAGAAVLVRPDGHVAAIIPPSQAHALPGMIRSLLEKAFFKESAA